MIVTPEQLAKVTTNDRNVNVVAEKLNLFGPKFGVNTPKRLAAFVGQCSVESVDFTASRESLYYKSAAYIHDVFPTNFPTVESARAYVRRPIALANRAYANRLGNGPESSGDGWKFRGGCWIQVTGKNGFIAASRGTGFNLIESPELIDQVGVSCVVSLWWWQSHGLNALADVGSINRITRIINGPKMMHAEERAARVARALKAFGAT